MRISWIAVAIGAVVAGAASVAALREHEFQLDRLSAAQAAKAGDLVDDIERDLAHRQALARFSMAAFRPRDRLDPDALEEFSRRVMPLAPEVFSMVWAPVLDAAEVEGALAAIGRSAPVTPGPNIPVTHLAPETQRFMVLDIRPRTDANMTTRGLILSRLAAPAEAIARAVTARDVRTTEPLRLIQLPEAPAFVIYGPVVGAEGELLGVIGFSYRFDWLFRPPREAGAALRVTDRDAAHQGPVFASGELMEGRRISRELNFGGRVYLAEMSFADDPAAVARGSALMVLAVGLAGALGLAAIAQWLAAVNRRLRGSLAAQSAAERQLRVVVGELNHRIGNMLGLVLSLGRQTFVPDRDLKESLRIFESRLAMLSSAQRIAADGAGAQLGDLVSAAADLFGQKLRAEGPPIALGPGSSQLIALLVHELATNATKYGALSGESGRVRVSWGEAADRFHLEWVEEGVGRPETSTRKGFGTRLLTELVPRQLGGEARREFRTDGLAYTLDAPLEALAR